MQMPGVGEYIHNMSMLSRNAKLFLVATTVRGIGNGIWGVLFNLYLSQVGFRPDFIGLVFTAGGITTGIVALPVGLACEKIGVRKALLLGETVDFVNLFMIWTLVPSVLLSVNILAGFIGTIGWVASAPFMMENSQEGERTYLFSTFWAFMVITGVIGNLVGGFLPKIFSLFLPSALGSALNFRLSLALAAGLAASSLLPFFMIKQRKNSQGCQTRDLLSFRNVKSWRTIIKFIVPTAIIGFGAGFIVPLFNLFFSLKFAASAEQIGLMSAVSNVTLGVGLVAAPALSRRLGKVRSVVLCEFISMPFIIFTTLAPNLVLAAGSYVTRNALMNMAGPIGTTLQMELVSETERATTSGFMVMADNVPRAITASASGVMMTGDDFLTPFLFTAATYFAASTIYFAFFRKAETKNAEAKPRSI
jgi:MFS family permease